MLYVERKKLKFFYNTKFTNECMDQFIEDLKTIVGTNLLVRRRKPN